MKRLYLLAGAGIVSMAALTSCIDDKYDLSDIDTTTQLRIDNLTVPINIDTMVLKDVLNVDDESNFRIVTINGEELYAVIKSADYQSDHIKIDCIEANSPYIEPAVCSIKGVPVVGSDKQFSFNLTNISNLPFAFNFDDVDESICAVEYIKTRPIYFDITLMPQYPDNVHSEIIFEGLEFRLPKGMDATCSKGTYDPKSGILKVNDLTTAKDQLKIRVTVSGIDIEANGLKLNEETHSFKYNGALEILRGVMKVTARSSSTTLADIKFTLNYGISNIVATGMKGIIKYDVEGVEIDPISLSDIPDFLMQEDTNILLTNPQVYLSFNNPVSEWKLKCQTGLEVRAVRENGLSKPYGLDNGTFTVLADRGEGPYNYVLSPIKPVDPLAYFADHIEHVPFSQLSEVIGNGPVPEALEIKLDNPCIPRQHVNDIPLGKELPRVHGRWELLAPLNLKAGSQIIYEGTEDGWNCEELEDLVVDQMEVTALVYSDFPCSLQMTVDPIDSNGNVIKDVELQSTVIPANADGSEMVVTLKGSFRDLDGVRYRAVVRTDKTTGDLTPDMKIKLDKIRVRVSGNWIKEL